MAYTPLKGQLAYTSLICTPFQFVCTLDLLCKICNKIHKNLEITKTINMISYMKNAYNTVNNINRASIANMNIKHDEYRRES
ncbi:hypothetical protein [Candidatus Cytomitobacter primus]|uniref:Uncharacterized protein n=1 Tax=Candidatus Cytomitobacter primus TaxID=2066024 RepID=A0A5C0UGF4_9PROT|nr:hypothetical protein [Candidatus Cytomitobacter primus]QEK38797.1 hypothetical protein FZC34_02700 [Candidatus Cytomitobacter primus]